MNRGETPELIPGSQAEARDGDLLGPPPENACYLGKSMLYFCQKRKERTDMNYDFRQNMVLHRKDCCKGRRQPGPGETAVTDAFEIVIGEKHSRLMQYAARDLAFFFAECAGIYLRVRYSDDMAAEVRAPGPKILLTDSEELPEFAPASPQKAAFTVRTEEDRILLCGRTDRGTAQGVYYLEDCCKLDGSNLVKKEDRELAPLFSPRMTHSGYGLDCFPDCFLETAAHAGMDAILVYAGHPDSDLHGFDDPDPLWPGSKRGLCDFRDLCYRAEGFGLDVYIYSHLKCDVYPTDPEAYAYYDASFGALMRSAPGIAGFVLVGETFEFPSRDPHTTGIRAQLPQPEGSGKPTPGWYPCSDYPLLLETVGKVVHAVNPDTELVFWTYNWGSAEKEARLSLIRSLPKWVTLLVTFDMWEYFHDSKGRTWHIDDYSISFEGPSGVYREEAGEAKKCGLRLYAMSNTGGRTWDCGIAPYNPTPQQWLKRYRALVRSREEHGLSGLMENHHYGWMPSFLSLFSKNVYWDHAYDPDDTELLRRLAGSVYGDRADLAVQAWEQFSEGIVNVTACAIDQYGPLRCGPSYPLLFLNDGRGLRYPGVPYAWHSGNGEIWFVPYRDPVLLKPDFLLLRLERITEAAARFEAGNRLLKKASGPLTGPAAREAAQQAAVSGILECTFRTAQHVMQWAIARELLLSLDALPECAGALFPALGLSGEERGAEALASCLKRIAEEETRNVAEAVRCWETNSLVGFECSMEYAFDGARAEYKDRLTEEALREIEAYVRTVREKK